MGKDQARQSSYGLDKHGILKAGPVNWNLTVGELYEHAVRRGEGVIADGGALACETGEHTGRSANDKFIVKEPTSDDDIWWGKINKPLEVAQFNSIKERLLTHLQGPSSTSSIVGPAPIPRIACQFVS